MDLAGRLKSFLRVHEKYLVNLNEKLLSEDAVHHRIELWLSSVRAMSHAVPDAAF